MLYIIIKMRLTVFQWKMVQER